MKNTPNNDEELTESGERVVEQSIDETTLMVLCGRCGTSSKTEYGSCALPGPSPACFCLVEGPI